MLALLRFMTWPRDMRRQDQALATWSAQMLSRTDTFAPLILQGGLALGLALAIEGGRDLSPERVARRAAELGVPDLLQPTARTLADEITHRIEQDLYSPAGGLAAVAEAPGAEALFQDYSAAATGGAYVSGLVLLAAASLRIHTPSAPVSVNRAIALVDVLKHRGFLPEGTPTGRGFWNFWPRWRGVAPLWAALTLASAPGTMSSTLEEPNGIAAALMGDLQGAPPSLRTMQMLFAVPDRRVTLGGWAVWLRDLAATLHPPNSRKPLLPATDSFCFVPGVTPIQPPVGRISSEHLERALLDLRR
jgi:hypothetical protein